MWIQVPNLTNFYTSCRRFYKIKEPNYYSHSFFSLRQTQMRKTFDSVFSTKRTPGKRIQVIAEGPLSIFKSINVTYKPGRGLRVPSVNFFWHNETFLRTFQKGSPKGPCGVARCTLDETMVKKKLLTILLTTSQNMPKWQKKTICHS